MTIDPKISEWDNLIWWSHIILLFSKRLTRRTETSKYAEENKTKVIPLVAASELGTAQTYIVLAI